MARKVIQIVSDNFLDPTAGQYCGIICLCDDGTIWSGQMTGGMVAWIQMNAPDAFETAQQPNNSAMDAIAALRELMDAVGSNKNLAILSAMSHAARVLQQHQ